MPVYKKRLVLRLRENIKAFLSLEVGATRTEITDSASQLNHAWRRIEEQDRLIQALAAGESGLRPDETTAASRIVWIFSSGRSGTTWLRDMMAGVDGFSAWEEPLVGQLVGNFYFNASQNKRRARNFIFSEQYRAVWSSSIRKLVLEGAYARLPGFVDGGFVVVKEPNGSVGAPLLSEALPESRLLAVVRDPRDVCASSFDAKKEGGWQFRNAPEADWTKRRLADTKPDEMIRILARNCEKDMSGAVTAHRNHAGPKALIKYEDLVSDTFGVLQSVYRDLDLDVSDERLRRTVDERSWANIPSEKKGAGKFYRRGAAGGWREDLTPKQVEIVEQSNSALIEEFYES